MFEDRVDAGKRLANALTRFSESIAGSTPVVLGLPRGGVVVAAEVAKALHGDLDLWCARKVLVPGRPELVLGAVAEGSELVVDHESVRASHLSSDQVRRTLNTRLREVERQCKRYRGERHAPDIAGRVVIVVDDGVANGATARAALRAIRRRGPAHLVLAIPVAGASALQSLAREADEIVCVEQVDRLAAVGFWYQQFRVVDDDTIIALLAPHQQKRTLRVFRVVPAGDGWGVVEGRARVTDKQPTKEAAIREARELAGGSGALVFVQAGSGHLDHETFAY